MPFALFSAVFQSLRFRLALWNTVVVFLTIVVTLIAVQVALHFTLLREADQLLLEDAAEVGLALETFYPRWADLYEEMNRKALSHRDRQWFVQFLGEGRKVLWASDGAPQLTALDSISKGPFMAGQYRVLSSTANPRRPPIVAYRLGSSLDLVNADIDRLTRMMWLVGGGMSLLSPLGGFWLAGRATRPLARMSRTAAELRPGRLNERLPIRGSGDELDRLSETINGLLDRIAEYLEQNRAFVANAAHELRSPLAAVQSSLEVALNADRSTAEYQELLAEIAEECSELRLLVNQLLILAESDARLEEANFVRCDLAEIVRRSVDMFGDAADEQGVRLGADRLATAPLLGQPIRLRQVVNNLIDNALKFNRPGGTVTLSVVRSAAEAELSVRDDGPGIPPEDLPRIFDRFFRGDRSRQREQHAAGAGLGLSICQAIVHAHRGRIEARSPPGGGTEFRVWLPLAAASSAIPETKRPGPGKPSRGVDQGGGRPLG